MKISPTKCLIGLCLIFISEVYTLKSRKVTLDFDYCQYGKNHVACKHPLKLVDTCNIDGGGGVAQMTARNKFQIVQMHNRYRNKLAVGQVNKFPKAARMGQLVWDEDLALMAQLNVMLCHYGHDENRRTAEFEHAGQNIGFSGTTLSYPTVDATIDSIGSSWFKEYEDTTVDDLKKFKRKSATGEVIGHFTAMIQDKATAVGCAALKHKEYSDRDGHLYFRTYLVCNYSYTNMLNDPVYAFAPAGKAAASGCTAPRSKETKYPGLCDAKEEIESVPNEPDLSTYTKKITKIMKYVTMDGREFKTEAEIRRLNVPYRILTTTKTTFIPPSDD